MRQIVSETAKAEMYNEKDICLLCFCIITWKIPQHNENKSINKRNFFQYRWIMRKTVFSFEITSQYVIWLFFKSVLAVKEQDLV